MCMSVCASAVSLSADPNKSQQCQSALNTRSLTRALHLLHREDFICVPTQRDPYYQLPQQTKKNGGYGRINDVWKMYGNLQLSPLLLVISDISESYPQLGLVKLETPRNSASFELRQRPRVASGSCGSQKGCDPLGECGRIWQGVPIHIYPYLTILSSRFSTGMSTCLHRNWPWPTWHHLATWPHPKHRACGSPPSPCTGGNLPYPSLSSPAALRSGGTKTSNSR